MSDFAEWAAFAGLANNSKISVEERLGCAVKAISLLEGLLEETRLQTVQVMSGLPEETPKAWRELIEGLMLLSKGQSNENDPTQCSHDQLTILSNPARFSPEEIEKLEAWGIHAEQDEEYFYSFRFGSA